MSCSKGTTHLRYRDDEAAALRAAAGRMKARAERAERAAGRAMTGSGGGEERGCGFTSVSKASCDWRGKKEELGGKSQFEFRRSHARVTREPRANLPLVLVSIPFTDSSHSPSAPSYACSDSYTAQLQQPLQESGHTQECQHPYPSITPRTEPQISERTLPLSSRMSITLRVQVPRYAPEMHKKCG